MSDLRAWTSSTRTFAAQHPGTCILCRSRIEPGEDQRRVFRLAESRRIETLSGWAHERCARQRGIPAFVGKR